MSGLLFQRNVRLTFGKSGQDGRSLSGLFTQFEVEKTSESSPNKAKISIYNLNEDSRSLLEEKKDTVVRLEVGYNNVLEDLFTGNDPRVVHERDGANLITRIEVGDGQAEFKKARINVTLPAGTTAKEAIEESIRQSGLGVGSIKGIISDVFQNGVTLSGAVRDKLDELTDKLGLEWSIEDGKVNVLPPEQPSSVTAILISPRTGLLNSPAKKAKDSKATPNDKTTTGQLPIEFEALIRPSVKPGVAVSVDSRDVSGFFKVRKVVYEGDSRSGPFKMRCEAIEIPSNILQAEASLNLGVIA